MLAGSVDTPHSHTRMAKNLNGHKRNKQVTRRHVHASVVQNLSDLGKSKKVKPPLYTDLFARNLSCPKKARG
jgi:hypothetical protein